eukprot:5071962-Prymnesium_polylepis.1
MELDSRARVAPDTAPGRIIGHRPQQRPIPHHTPKLCRRFTISLLCEWRRRLNSLFHYFTATHMAYDAPCGGSGRYARPAVPRARGRYVSMDARTDR